MHVIYTGGEEGAGQRAYTLAAYQLEHLGGLLFSYTYDDIGSLLSKSCEQDIDENGTYTWTRDNNGRKITEYHEDLLSDRIEYRSW